MRVSQRWSELFCLLGLRISVVVFDQLNPLSWKNLEFWKKCFQRYWTTVSLTDRVYKFCFFFRLKLLKGLQFLTTKVHFFKRSRASERCRSWVLWKSVTFSIKLIWMFVWNELTKILFFDNFCVCAWLLWFEMPNIRVLFPLELKYYTAKLIHTERKH